MSEAFMLIFVAPLAVWGVLWLIGYFMRGIGDGD